MYKRALSPVLLDMILNHISSKDDVFLRIAVKNFVMFLLKKGL